jgi:hypothetical protein
VEDPRGHLLADRYRLGAPVRGLAGSFEGWDLREQRAVVVTPIASDGENDPQRAHAARVAAHWASLPHGAGRRTLCDSFEHRGARFVVAVALEGETLARALRRDGRFDLDEALLLVVAVAEALRGLHDQGLAHGAVAPDLVWLTGRDPRQALLELPLAASDVVARQQWCSPQAALIGRNATLADDVWGLGALLHGLSTGEPPYAEREPAALARAQAAAPPLPLDALVPQMPRALVELVARCTALDAAARPASAADVAEALRALVDARGGRLDAAHRAGLGSGRFASARPLEAESPRGARSTSRTADPLDREAPDPPRGADRKRAREAPERIDALCDSGERAAAPQLARATGGEALVTPTPGPTPHPLRRSGARATGVEQEDEPTPGALAIAQARLRAEAALAAPPNAARSPTPPAALAIAQPSAAPAWSKRLAWLLVVALVVVLAQLAAKR